MSEIVVQEFVTLDGVIQGPGMFEEDRDGGFALGGWQSRHRDDDPELDAIIQDWESRTGALLLGRRTYDIWLGAWAVWSEEAEGFLGEQTRRYNRIPKYVASTTLTDPTWRNTHVLGDVPGEVARLRSEHRDGEIRVWGSSRLVATLAAHDLVDEYRLAVYPIVLGTGKRLFPDGFPLSRFERGEVRPLDSGVTVTAYRRGAAG
jgi:dihydrofolate reductase